MVVALKAAWEVRGGIILGESDPQLGRRWVYTSLDHEQDVALLEAETARGLDPSRPDAPKTIFQQRKDEALAYWNKLNDPVYNNWADITWIWF